MPDETEAPWWHVVWVTHGMWPPADARGDWRDLTSLYADLPGVLEVSEPLPANRQCRPARDAAVLIPPAAMDDLDSDLRNLLRSDRVAGRTPVGALATDACSVQLLVSIPAASLHQRIGRLKSRSSTLLHFRHGPAIGGAGTWAKGFWWARLSPAAINAVAAYIERPAMPVHPIDFQRSPEDSADGTKWKLGG